MALALCLVFAASGAAALVFETLWFQQAGLAFGNGVWSGALVLAAFMAGNALGSGMAARHGDRVRAPLRVFAAIELGIGATGVLLVLALPALGRELAPWLAGLPPLLRNAARLAVAFVLLLIPATGMGATLPLLVRVLRAHERNFAVAVGRLYGWNTLGAVAGALSAATWLLEHGGVRGAALAAGSLDFAVAAAALGLARRLPAALPAQPLPEPTSPLAALALGPARRLAAAALAGAAFLALEVVWFRFLDLFVAGTQLAFALMLAAVLAGLGLGSLAGSQALWLRPALARQVSPLAFALAASVWLSYAGFPALIEQTYRGQIGLSASVFVLAASLTLIPAFLSGAFFVWLAADLRECLHGDARSSGWLLLANTLGGAAGSLGAAFALLPGLGMERALFALGLLYTGAGALLWPPRVRRGAALAAALAAAVSALCFPFGALRDVYLPSIAQHSLPGSHWRILEVRESSSETLVYVEERAPDARPALTLLTNGHRMASTHWSARRYMKLFAWLPAALHPAPRRALLISYGVGNTAAALVGLPELEALDVVDISAEVLRASAWIYPEPGSDPLQDARVRAHVEDGRFFLAASSGGYDLISAEPPPPNAQGVVNLYSLEYFALLRERLAEGGYASHWLPLHTLPARGARAVIAAFCGVFSDCSLWSGSGYDLILLGSRGARGPVPESKIARLWADPARRTELSALQLEVPERLGALFLADSARLLEIAGDTPPLVDDFPLRINGPPPGVAPIDPRLRALALGAGAAEAFAASPSIAALWPPELRARTQPHFARESELQRRTLSQ